MDEIAKLVQMETQNYEVSRERLGDAAELVQDLVELYQTIGDFVTSSAVKPRDEIVAGGMFLYSCRYQLVLAALNIMRGHLNDSYFFTRKAIELCAFANRVKGDPPLAMKWLQAWRTQASYKEFRKGFATRDLFPSDHPLLAKLFVRYDLCSKLIHSSVYSLSGQMQTEHKEDLFEMTFSYSQLDDSHTSEPIGSWLSMADAHFGILQVFEQVLEEVVAHDKTKWDIRRNAFDGKLTFQKAKWHDLLQKAATRRHGDEPSHS
jgi:hypothetical protein